MAIDRFTGGAAPGLKFDADYADRPRLTGKIRVDLDRIEPWALGLLALTFRDLIEGDITFGFGASKGYGICQATIISIAPTAHFGRCTDGPKIGVYQDWIGSGLCPPCWTLTRSGSALESA